jgi:hypothetical protein
MSRKHLKPSKRWAMLVGACLFICAHSIYAQYDPQKAAGSFNGMAESALSNLNGGDPSKVLPKYSNQNSNEQFFGEGDLIPTDQGNGKITDCKTATGDPNLYTRQECEGVNYVMKNRTVRPNMTVSTKDPLISENRTITSDPRDTLEKYKFNLPYNADGSIGNPPPNACASTTVTTPAVFEERVCTFFRGSENFLCKAPLKVEVNPHFNYKCEDTLGVNSNEKCSKTLIVECNGGGGFGDICSSTGIIPGGVEADMAVKWSPTGSGFYTLEFGTFQDNYWSGPKYGGTIYERTLNVNIASMDKLDRFLFFYIMADDYSLVTVNGTVVYGTPPLIDRIEHPGIGIGKVNGIKYGPKNEDFMRYVERKPSFGDSANPNVDLRPYLHNGMNKIVVRTVVGGTGEMLTKFSTRSACSPVCIDRWVNQCTTLEQRAK